MKAKFELGPKLQDVVTGYTGIVTAITFWLNGCVRYNIQSQSMKDGKPIDSECFDEAQLALVDDGLNVKKRATGGPFPAQKPMGKCR